MKLIKDIVIRNIADEVILIPTGHVALKTNGLITVSKSGELLIKRLQIECTIDDLVDCLMEEYDVNQEVAEKDVKLFLDKLRNLGLLEE